MGNPAGVLAVFAALGRPGLVVPHAQVDDVTSIDWEALREAGVRHIVIDKDNCITLPLDDNVYPDFVPAWERMAAAGFDSVLVVSNSAGSSDDPLAIGAEHLARTLKQRVLAHPDKKPAKACARQILDVFDEDQRSIASTSTAGEPKPPAHVAVIGDRITTDIILATRMQRILRQRLSGGLVPSIVQRLRALQSSSSSQAATSAPDVVGILTTRVLAPERMGTRVLRRIEMWTLSRLVALGITPGGSWLSGRKRAAQSRIDWQGIVSRGTDVAATSPRQGATSVADFDDAAAAAQTASQEASAQLPIAMRIRMLPSLALQKIGGATLQAGVWLGQGWCLMQDGIRLGTKGRIGSPDANRMRQSRLLGAAGDETDLTAMHLRDGWPSTSQMFARNQLGNASSARTQPARISGSSASDVRRRTFATSSRLLASHATRTGSGPQRPPPGWKPNYAAAAAAFILMPTGWYVGTLLHDYLNPPPSAEVVAEEAHRLQQQAHPHAAAGGGGSGVTLSEQTEQLSKRGSRSAAASLQDLFTGKPSVQSLYTRRVSIERELERTEEKLAEVRARIAARNHESGPITTDDEAAKQKQHPIREPTNRGRII